MVGQVQGFQAAQNINNMNVIHSVLDVGGYFFFLAPTTAIMRQEIAKVEVIVGAIVMAYAELALKYTTSRSTTLDHSQKPAFEAKIKKYNDLKDVGLSLVKAGLADFFRAAVELASFYSGPALFIYDKAIKRMWVWLRNPAAQQDSNSMFCEQQVTQVSYALASKILPYVDSSVGSQVAPS